MTTILVVALGALLSWFALDQLVRSWLGLAAALTLMRLGWHRAGLGLLRALADRYPRQPDIALHLVSALLHFNQLPEALRRCDDLLEIGLEAYRSAILDLRANALSRLGRTADAEAARNEADSLVRAVTNDAEPTPTADVDQLLAVGDLVGAQALLDRLIREGSSDQPSPTDLKDYDGELARLRVKLAQTDVLLGQWRAALAAVELVLGRGGQPDPVRHDAHQAAARAYLAIGRLEQAQRDADDAFRLANTARDTRRLADDCKLLGDIAAARGDYVGAMAHYQRVRECGRAERPLADLAESELLALWGRPNEALTLARRALSRATDKPAWAAQAAVLTARQLAERDPAGAWALLRQHVDTPLAEPRLAARRSSLAASLAQQHGDDADRWLDEVAAARRVLGHDASLMAELDADEAERAWQAGRIDEADALLARALERPPDPHHVPRLLLRRAECAARQGHDQRPLLREVAAHEVALGAVEDARRRLAGA